MRLACRLFHDGKHVKQHSTHNFDPLKALSDDARSISRYLLTILRKDAADGGSTPARPSKLDSWADRCAEQRRSRAKLGQEEGVRVEQQLSFRSQEPSPPGQEPSPPGAPPGAGDFARSRSFRSQESAPPPPPVSAAGRDEFEDILPSAG